MENEEKGLIFHFEDEKEVLNKHFSILSFMSYNTNSMNFEHNGKIYNVTRKVVHVDADPTYIDLYLKPIKQ